MNSHTATCPAGRRCGVFLFTLCLAFFQALPCSAQEGGGAPPPSAEPATRLPEAKDVIARYVRAIGGEQAVRAHKSRLMRGEMEVRGAFKAPLVLYSAPPHRMLVEITLPEVGVVRRGFDGEVGWMIDPEHGPMIFGQETLEQSRREADFYGDISFDRRFKTMESLDEREYDGVKCYSLRMVSQGDEESIFFFEVESGLLRGMTQVQETAIGPMKMTSVNKEYKEFGGVKFPVHTEVEMAGRVQSLRFTAIEIDTVKDEVFNLPDEISALVKEGEAKAEPKREN